MNDNDTTKHPDHPARKIGRRPAPRCKHGNTDRRAPFGPYPCKACAEERGGEWDGTPARAEPAPLPDYISPDQNSRRADGVELVTVDGHPTCAGCHFFTTGRGCSAPHPTKCAASERQDARSIVWAKATEANATPEPTKDPPYSDRMEKLPNFPKGPEAKEAEEAHAGRCARLLVARLIRELPESVDLPPDLLAGLREVADWRAEG